MTHEIDIRIADIIPPVVSDDQKTNDHTVLPISDLDSKLDLRQSSKGNAVDSLIPDAESLHFTELNNLSLVFREHVKQIGLLMRDHGHTQHEVLQFEHSLPSINNQKDQSKYEILEQLTKRRAELAITNYPLYLEYLSKISPEQPERFLKLRDEYMDENTSYSRRAGISEELRAELERVVHWKTTFYTEMLITAMIDAGEDPEKAEDIALKSQEVITTRANSLVEKVSLFETFKTESLTFLISHLSDSILVWEELFPGDGELEEIKILGERKESRMKKAKDLYKRTKTEMEKRYADYKTRAEAHFKLDGTTNGHDVSAGIAHRKAADSVALLLEKPRLEQIRIMNSYAIIN
jgi:hypothetical protein